jgi:hypothetical protein
MKSHKSIKPKQDTIPPYDRMSKGGMNIGSKRTRDAKN